MDWIARNSPKYLLIINDLSYGGERGIRTRSAIILRASYRFQVAKVAIDAIVARAAWPILAHGEVQLNAVHRIRGQIRRLLRSWASSSPFVFGRQLSKPSSASAPDDAPFADKKV
jgi:hypothetical protein